MYASYYGFRVKPFQLRPDPSFFFGSRGHKRAMAYLEYGLSQGEGFIVITGEVGAGKTTLVRNLFRTLESENILAAQIVNTHLDSDDTLRMVAAAFGLPYENSGKASLLIGLEEFFRKCDQQGKRALLVVDEAQNLSPRTVEELRMLSNFQTDDKPLLQTFLLGQPEFRRTLLSGDMQQLRQRVTATYHLGPMDLSETQSYIEHRLSTAGWSGDPSFDESAFAAIYDYTGGIPRKINTLCDRLLLMGCLEKLHGFGGSEVDEVIRDIQQEFDMPTDSIQVEADIASGLNRAEVLASVENMDKRVAELEGSVVSLLELLKQVLSLAGVNKNLRKDKV
ncbi:putative secretion ATPase (PEP-CTERM system associated) [Nitrosospira sp. Nsp5]|uniref:Secretion ATPase, PEP-CTERM locus subfamily n=1 Tax=Nitrosospira multiformis TaxID=1231 RepID=A0ABY0T5X7_9PROT|nr:MULTISPECIES: XrtA/PEP-CTERM system-associated ATPase [Nitrosospira]PTR09483.1 putative secretion ATPase (PEP-CTERM system associated) [Nitrosospira sp. Nsp5]SDQ28943.1 putative secretion ATPase, PEP-CTERM locus subfamily [Nitrosospira multiformis]